MDLHLISNPRRTTQGFTLVELAIVLLIVALLTGGLMLGITAQRNAAENSDAQRQLENIREALIGYAMANGRLPCPANPGTPSASGAGNEYLKQCSSKVDCVSTDLECSLEFGVIPWSTLGIPEVDPWGSRFTYFVGREFSDPLIKKEIDAGVRTRFRMETAGRANVEDGAGHVVAGNVPAVIVSHGTRGAGAYQTNGAQLPFTNIGNEGENSDADLTFVSRTPDDSFDDIVVWIAPTILKSKMVAAGRLP